MYVHTGELKYNVATYGQLEPIALLPAMQQCYCKVQTGLTHPTENQ